jgi:molybdopterin converting factor subunit 1
MNKIKVMFFATIRQRAGAKFIEIEVPEEMHVQGLLDKLSQDIPDLREPLKTVVVAINREFAPEDRVIPANAEVALFPPVSGG